MPQLFKGHQYSFCLLSKNCRFSHLAFSQKINTYVNFTKVLLNLKITVLYVVFLAILFIFLIQIERKLVLLSVLKEPVSRSIFDYALRSKDITSLFRHLHMRQKKRNGSLPDCPPPEDPAIAQLLKKLLSQVVSPF